VHSQHPPQVFAGWLTKAGVSSSIPARLSQLTYASPSTAATPAPLTGCAAI